MTALTPKQLDATLAYTLSRLKRGMAELPDLYRWAYGASHERVVRETAGRSPGPADPTGSTVGDPLAARLAGRAAVRRTLERVPKKLAEIENTLTAIEREIARAMDRLDPREGFEPLRYPISVKDEELEESREAQARRRERREHIA